MRMHIAYNFFSYAKKAKHSVDRQLSYFCSVSLAFYLPGKKTSYDMVEVQPSLYLHRNINTVFLSANKVRVFPPECVQMYAYFSLFFWKFNWRTTFASVHSFFRVGFLKEWFCLMIQNVGHKCFPTFFSLPCHTQKSQFRYTPSYCCIFSFEWWIFFSWQKHCKMWWNHWKRTELADRRERRRQNKDLVSFTKISVH